MTSLSDTELELNWLQAEVKGLESMLSIKVENLTRCRNLLGGLLTSISRLKHEVPRPASSGESQEATSAPAAAPTITDSGKSTEGQIEDGKAGARISSECGTNGDRSMQSGQPEQQDISGSEQDAVSARGPRRSSAVLEPAAACEHEWLPIAAISAGGREFLMDLCGPCGAYRIRGWNEAEDDAVESDLILYPQQQPDVSAEQSWVAESGCVVGPDGKRHMEAVSLLPYLNELQTRSEQDEQREIAADYHEKSLAAEEIHLDDIQKLAVALKALEGIVESSDLHASETLGSCDCSMGDALGEIADGALTRIRDGAPAWARELGT